MKAMKGLLLGTAAGMVAISGAQAADLPVKAKPVEYVKVCSLYGAGFFYVPGTDTCLKIGMYIRSDHAYGNAAIVSGVYSTTNSNTRTTTDLYSYRARVNLTTDWRTQSDYGVIRAYAAIQVQQSSGDLSINANSLGAPASTGQAGILRAFIQFAGFTVGHAVSFFDFFNGADYGYVPGFNASTGVNGIDILGYTWQLGNGVSVSVDIEDGSGAGSSTAPGTARSRNVVNASAAAQLGNGITADAQRAWTPDIAGNIRIDQAWGSAQLSAAFHNLSGGYYSTGNVPFVATVNGHPGDEWGYALGAGFRLTNFLQPKDTLEAQFVWANGAASYTHTNPANFTYGSGNSFGMGYVLDGVFVTGSGIEKTDTWKAELGYQHYWNAQWRTSVYAIWTGVEYSDTARNMLCGVTGSAALYTNVAGTPANCSPNFTQRNFSTRTAWNPHPSLEIGLDLIYWHLDTANAGAQVLNTNGSRVAGPYIAEDQDRYMAVLRFQKTILP